MSGILIMIIICGVIIGWISIDLLLIFKIVTPTFYNIAMGFVGGFTAYMIATRMYGMM